MDWIFVAVWVLGAGVLSLSAFGVLVRLPAVRVLAGVALPVAFGVLVFGALFGEQWACGAHGGSAVNWFFAGVVGGAFSGVSEAIKRRKAAKVRDCLPIAGDR